MRNKIVTTWALMALLGAVGAAAQTPRAIEELKPGFFRAQNNQHYTVFLVTREGIILSDPISTEFAQWLRAELDRRFDVPVRYVLYSHHHWDHASGGAVFADTAEFVGHEAMPAKLALPPASTPLPPAATTADGNRDGRIERGEATGDGADLIKALKLPSGTLYPILLRFERAGLFESWWEEADTSTLNRPRRRLYRITQTGCEVARKALMDLSVLQLSSAYKGL